MYCTKVKFCKDGNTLNYTNKVYKKADVILHVQQMNKHYL